MPPAVTIPLPALHNCNRSEHFASLYQNPPTLFAGVLSLNPAPENTKVVGSKDPNYPNMPIDPNYIFGSVQTTRSPFFSSYPQQVRGRFCVCVLPASSPA